MPVQSEECRVQNERHRPSRHRSLSPLSSFRSIFSLRSQRPLRLILFVFVILAAAGPLRAGIGMGTIEEDPETRKAKVRQQVEGWYKDGMKARAAGNLSDAVKFLKWAASTRCDTEFPELAFNELKAISEDAKKELEVARQLAGGEDPAVGLDELKRITRIYSGLGVAKDAGALARQLEADPSFQAKVKAGRLAGDLKKAEALEAQAEAIVRPPATEKPPAVDPAPAGKAPGVITAAVKPKEMTEAERKIARLDLLGQAYEAYGRIAQQGGETEPGRKAADARTRLEKDAELVARIKAVDADTKARALMKMADGYFAAGRTDLARRQCMKVISDFPQSQQAADARALLARMK
jgi:tetratricopeptide (TPR) repeat protein